MANNIVQTNVFVTASPLPATLQQSVTFVSQGATTLSPGSSQLLSSSADLADILAGSAVISSLVQTAGVATATLASAVDVPVGSVVAVTVAGANDTRYNGTVQATFTSETAFTYSVPSATTTPDTGTPVFTLEDVAELAGMNSTYFGQGSAASVSVLELGVGSVDEGVASLATYTSTYNNSEYTSGAQGYFYAYEVPRAWGANANFRALAATFSSPSAKTYFVVTMDLESYLLWSTTKPKSVIAVVETPETVKGQTNPLTSVTWAAGHVTALTTTPHGLTPGVWFQIQGVTPTAYNGWYQALPGTTASTIVYALATNPGAETALGVLAAQFAVSSGVAASEFSASAILYGIASAKPSSAARLQPFAFRYAFGVTPWPTPGNSSLFAALKAANVNIFGTGQEGGISNSITFWGTTLDGNDIASWYSIDWFQINLKLNTANAVIVGSNSQPPLVYNQPGITTLQGVAASTAATGISYGLANGALVLTQLDAATFAANVQAGLYTGQVVINADPLASYLNENPNDFAIGQYNGLSFSFSPVRGFKQIVYTVDVQDILS